MSIGAGVRVGELISSYREMWQTDKQNTRLGPYVTGQELGVNVSIS